MVKLDKDRLDYIYEQANSHDLDIDLWVWEPVVQLEDSGEVRTKRMYRVATEVGNHSYAFEMESKLDDETFETHLGGLIRRLAETVADET